MNDENKNINNADNNNDVTKVYNIVREEEVTPLNLPVKKKKRSIIKGIINISAFLVVVIIIMGMGVGVFGITLATQMVEDSQN